MAALLRSARVRLALVLVAAAVVGSLAAAERSAAPMAAAATKFVAALTPEQRQQAVAGFDVDDRMHWHFIPTETFPRKGLLIRDMTPAQRTLAHDLLKAGLSQRGYMTATQIMDLETVLGDLERRERAASGRGGNALERNPEKYFFSVFGTPSTKDTWGWRVEGHHISLHFTLVNGMIAASPSF